MLRITVPQREMWNEERQEFLYTKGQNLQLEHSLISLSKWESKWEKPFLTEKDKSLEETLDYIKCMTLTQNVDPGVYVMLTSENIQQIYNYIDAPMTATTVYHMSSNSRSSEQVTAELIYYWMIALNIPFECQKWHLNRLLTLIDVCSVKSQPPRKMSPGEIRKRNSALNAARRKKLKSKG